MSMQEPNAPVATGLVWVALESLNAYHLSLQQLQFLILTRYH